MKIDSGDYENGNDGGDYPIHHEAERRPPPGICNVLTAMLPKVLEPVAEQPDHQEPRGSRDGSGGEHHEDARDRTLDGNDGPRPSATARPMQTAAIRGRLSA